MFDDDTPDLGAGYDRSALGEAPAEQAAEAPADDETSAGDGDTDESAEDEAA